eukprot:Amastigsp_a162_583.p3 type:complete len:118 gc:universal Amastigsp_a162_583:1355-1708(+)
MVVENMSWNGVGGVRSLPVPGALTLWYASRSPSCSQLNESTTSRSALACAFTDGSFDSSRIFSSASLSTWSARNDARVFTSLTMWSWNRATWPDDTSTGCGVSTEHSTSSMFSRSTK